MALVTLKTVLTKAYRNGYAVGAFNIINLTFLEAIIDAARRTASPVILNVAEVHFPFVTMENIVPVVREIAKREQFDIVLNLDHGLTMQAIERAIANDFTSIMFDGSHLGFEENIRQTCEVVKMCHARNISVEAELGAVGGAEGGGLVGEADPAKYTDVKQAKRFVEKTGVDALAVAIGNSHGRYKGKPDLDFERLCAIRDVTGIPLVLHGGSGISVDDFRKAISLGIAKVNFFTGMSDAALQATKKYLGEMGERYNDYPMLMNAVKAGVTQVVAEQMEIFGSTGQAETGLG
ncbi:MAG TPA: ketose 1,6-bisphosphate aldolase [Anaerolineales bacterium]|nr:ketose 1,6-bisphosphate aldolase [Anaerolineales bacterium]